MNNGVFPGSIPSPVSPQNFTAYLNRSSVEHVVDKGVSATDQLDDALVREREVHLDHRLA